MELPSHPEGGESADDRRPTTRNRVAVVVVALAVVALALLVILHVTGVVGPAAN